MVGATKQFIRRPFIWKSVKLGIIGAVLALIGMSIVLYYLNKTFTELELLSENDLKNEFILFSMNIETYLMDGSYNKILGIKAELANKNDSRYDKFEKNFNKGGTFCRDCEEKLYTINADGTLSGCPNAAPEEQFGHINQDIKTHTNMNKIAVGCILILTVACTAQKVDKTLLANDRLQLLEDHVNFTSKEKLLKTRLT